MQVKSNFARSSNVSNLTKTILKSAAAEMQKSAMVKSASAPVKEVTRIPLEQADTFFKSATKHGLGVYESDGNVWMIEKDADGKQWLVRNSELTNENELVEDIMKSASIDGDNKVFFT